MTEYVSLVFKSALRRTVIHNELGKHCENVQKQSQAIQNI